MHRSQLAGFIIDCEGGDLDAAADFWSKALGYEARPPHDPADDIYRSLDTGADRLNIELQRVDHPSRVHLDIEADDIEAEVERLEALGAKRVKSVKTWWVMEAPTGHRFCVVGKFHDDFDSTARQW